MQESLACCTLIFWGALTEFLPADKSEGRIVYPLERKASIKDIIESLGPPHTEVGSIRTDGRDVDFTYHPGDSEILWVRPPEPPVNPLIATPLEPNPLRSIRFVVDVNVGKTASLLRILGFDTAYHWSWRDGEIAGLADREERIVLTKDLGLLKRKKVRFGHFIRADNPEAQLREVLSFYGLRPPFALFSRCLRCNIPLLRVEKEAIEHRLEAKTKKYFFNFSICPDCKRIYWAGSHQEEMRKRLAAVGIIEASETAGR